MPRHPVLAILFAGVFGLLFPLCECGMIPVVRRLIRKGMPAYAGIVYILAGPIVNPVVFTSTYTAFKAVPEMAYARLGLAFTVAAITGLILWRTYRSHPLKADLASVYAVSDEEALEMAVGTSGGRQTGFHAEPRLG